MKPPFNICFSKVVLLAYSRGLISSRKLEQACRENVVFMASACGQQPDHSTIAAFVSSLKDEILPLFRDVLLVCESFWGARCLPWMVASCLPTPRKSGAALSPSKLLRHTNYQTAGRYLQLVDPNLRETLRLLEGT